MRDTEQDGDGGQGEAGRGDGGAAGDARGAAFSHPDLGLGSVPGAGAGAPIGRGEQARKPSEIDILKLLLMRASSHCSVQGDPSGRQLHFVYFDLVVSMSALFCSRKIWQNWHGM